MASCTSGKTFLLGLPDGTLWYCWPHVHRMGDWKDVPPIDPERIGETTTCKLFACIEHCERPNIEYEKDGVLHQGRSWKGHQHTHFIINVNGACNYNCDYCGLSSKKNNGFLLRFHETKPAHWLDISRRIVDQGRTLSIGLTGGETMIYSGIYDLLRGLVDIANRIEVVTNASLLRFEDLANLPKDKIVFHISYHPSDPQFSHFLFLNNVRSLKHLGYETIVTLVDYLPQRFSTNSFISSTMQEKMSIFKAVTPDSSKPEPLYSI